MIRAQANLLMLPTQGGRCIISSARKSPDSNLFNSRSSDSSAQPRRCIYKLRSGNYHMGRRRRRVLQKCARRTRQRKRREEGTHAAPVEMRGARAKVARAAAKRVVCRPDASAASLFVGSAIKLWQVIEKTHIAVDKLMQNKKTHPTLELHLIMKWPISEQN
jgi:hypothetical protein